MKWMNVFKWFKGPHCWAARVELLTYDGLILPEECTNCRLIIVTDQGEHTFSMLEAAMVFTESVYSLNVGYRGPDISFVAKKDMCVQDIYFEADMRKLLKGFKTFAALFPPLVRRRVRLDVRPVYVTAGNSLTVQLDASKFISIGNFQ